MEQTDLRDHLEHARAEGAAAIERATDLASLEEARVRALGRKSLLAQARAALGRLPESDRKTFGQLANEVQRQLEQALAAKQERLRGQELEARWERERIDVTLPGEPMAVGSLHPLTKTMWQIVDIFVGLGYKLVEGPEVEQTRYNFDALNIPPQHPSRSPQDTYYVKGNDDLCLRPQTSPVQMRVMESQDPPVYVVVPGRCYRRDELDATHLSQFSQIEALAVDEGITMGDLKGTLEAFARELFGKNLEVRLRPSFFPFTEPSAEMDVQCFACKGAGCRVCKGEGWVEVLGCGMVDPFLLEWAGYDPERYSGFALGLGIERVTALSHGVGDIRWFYENDIRFLEQFAGIA